MSTLSPWWQYSHVLIEADLVTANKYMKTKLGLSESFVKANFIVQAHQSIDIIAAVLQVSIRTLENSKHTLVINKSQFPDGCTCVKCGDFYQYAEPNQSDGTLVCYRCRNPMS